MLIPFGTAVNLTCCSGCPPATPPRAKIASTAAASAAVAPPSANLPNTRRRRCRSIFCRSPSIVAAIRAPISAGVCGAAASNLSGSAWGSICATGCSSANSARHCAHPSRCASSPARSAPCRCPSAWAPSNSRHSRHSFLIFIAHLLEHDPQCPQPVVDAALDRPLRHAEFLRDLRVGTPAVVGLDDHPPGVLADPPHRLLHLPGEQRLLQRLDARLDPTLGDSGPHRPCPPQVDDDVAEDREEPGPQRPDLRVEPIPRPPGADEGLLHRLFGEPGVA